MKLRYILRICGIMCVVVTTLVMFKIMLRTHGKKSLLTVNVRLPTNKHSRTDAIFSVIAVNVSLNSQWDIYAVNMWIEAEQRASVKCCYLLEDESVIRRNYLRMNIRENMFDHVAQVECPSLQPVHPVSNIAGITVKCSCPEQRDGYIAPEYPIQPNDGFKFALCSKIVYGDIDINLTIEWVEYNMRMGVDKVLLYTYNISSTVLTMLQYYENKGFLTLIPYHLPFQGNDGHEVGAKTTEAWNDEQVAVYDCQVRLRSYDFVGIIDLDEFIVPIMDNNFKMMLERLMYLLPNMAAAEVYGEMFVLDWQKTNPSDKLMVTQYRYRTNSSKPVDINQRKLIHIPSRVERGSVVTHGLKTFNDSYLIFKDPVSVMVINHYRKCVAFREDCHSRLQILDQRIVRHMAPKVIKTIGEVKKHFESSKYQYSKIDYYRR